MNDRPPRRRAREEAESMLLEVMMRVLVKREYKQARV
jgi:hypothetical protein